MATTSPIPQPGPERLPDYLPARMVNEFVYCPRLFFLEWVEALFADSPDTIEGRVLHLRVDRKASPLPAPDALPEERIHARSITLSSDTHRLIATLDLLEVEGAVATPVDYKHGKPRETDSGIELWPTDRVQLAVQAILLRENGYTCNEGIVYYAKTRQRVRVPFDDPLIAETLQIAAQAWQTAAAGRIPPPLADSPKCPGCSLVNICLPEETANLHDSVPPAAPETGPEPEQLTLFPLPPSSPKPQPRLILAPRSELRPLYLNTQGLRLGKSGGVLQVREKDALREEIRLSEINQLNVYGNIQITTQTVQSLCEAGVPICYFSQGGWFYGITAGLNSKNVFLRQSQFRLAAHEGFCLQLSRKLIAGKIRNQRTLLLRNHLEPPANTLRELKEMAARAESARSLPELLGIEGNAARLYFGEFSGMLKSEDAPDPPVEAAPPLPFDFTTRNRRPPRDPVNALLSLAYSVLAKDLTIACYAVGFDPYMGFYHQPRFGRPALALDLMEPFRPIVADSAVITAINTRMVTPYNFIRAAGSVALTPEGRKAFFRAYELRMDTLITHPVFEYRVSYRRLLEIQARLLARLLEGEIGDYPVFVTR